MIKLIGTDFDGTLLDDNKVVPKENIKSLIKSKEQGIKIVGVTARTLESVKNVVDISIFDYLILNNGSNIYDVSREKTIYDNSISYGTAKEITDLIDEYTYQFDYCTFSSYHLYKNFKESHLSFVKEVKSVDEVEDPISKINIFTNAGVDNESLKKEVEEHFPNIRVMIMQDSGNERRWLVATPDDLNKKESLKYLGDYLNISLEDMMFFGDGLNDLEVMEGVGLGVAMGNALEEVKDRSKDTTISNNEAGVSYYINEYLKKTE